MLFGLNYIVVCDLIMLSLLIASVCMSNDKLIRRRVINCTFKKLLPLGFEAGNLDRHARNSLIVDLLI